jgi:hypothetical protein
VRHSNRDLAIADDPGVLSPLRSQANLVADRLHPARDLVGDLQSARQRGGGEGCAMLAGRVRHVSVKRFSSQARPLAKSRLAPRLPHAKSARKRVGVIARSAAGRQLFQFADVPASKHDVGRL